MATPAGEKRLMQEINTNHLLCQREGKTGVLVVVASLDMEIDDVTFNESAALPSSSRHQCDNCGGQWEDSDLHEIRDFFQRVVGGGVVPSGECPECGCLCYPFQ